MTRLLLGLAVAPAGCAGADAPVVRLVGQAYRSDAAPDSRLDGGGGVDLWQFEAVGPGEAEVVVGQFPPGRQPPAHPFATHTYTLVVE